MKQLVSVAKIVTDTGQKGEGNPSENGRYKNKNPAIIRDALQSDYRLLRSE